MSKQQKNRPETLDTGEQIVLVGKNFFLYSGIPLAIMTILSLVTSNAWIVIGASIVFIILIYLQKDKLVMGLTDSVDSLVNNANQLLGALDGISEDSSSASRQLKEATNTTSNSMQEIHVTLQQLASVTEELGNSIDDIDRGTQAVNGLTKDGLENISHMEEKMSSILEGADKAANLIAEVHTSSNQIGNITEVISGIAEQTNLLALNASIEAARAGEQGKGFGVVAEEIRKLAQGTEDALERINSLVNNLVNETIQAVDFIKENNKQITDGEQVLKQTAGSFRVIADNIEKMVKNVQHTVNASRQITSGSQEISASTENQTTAIGEIDELALSLSNMANELKEVLANTSLGGFKVEVDIAAIDSQLKSMDDNSKRRLREELGLKPGFVIGVIARLEPIKGHGFFFDGLKRVLAKYPNVQCIVIGDGSLMEELSNRVAREGFGNSVKLLGYRKDIQKILSIVDLVVLTSEKEGLPPQIIVEAMTAYKPVVVTDVPGNRFLVTEGQDGFLVPFNDVDKLFTAIEFFVKSPDKCPVFGKQARKRIEKVVSAK